MQFTTFIVAIFAATVAASPVDIEVRGGGGGGGSSYNACPSGLYNLARCCDTNVLGVIGINCQPTSSAPTSASNFNSVCSKTGKTALCCSIIAADLGVLCQSISGA